MEESEKIIGKKKLPSIPSNYVTLLQLQERWIKEQERKRKEKEKEEPQQQEEKETKVEERVNDEVAGRGSREKGYFRRYDRDNGKRVAEKREEEGTAATFTVNKNEDAEKGKNGGELKNEKKKEKKQWKKKKKNKKEEKARVENQGEEVVGPAVNAPLPASVENNKGKEVVIGDEVHAPKQASVPIPRTDVRTVEIERKFRAMSMKGEIRKGDYGRHGLQKGNFKHFGGNREPNKTYYYYGKFERRREQNQRNEGMVWVKKEEVGDGHVGGIQSSRCSSK
ncbi:cilia- and flagella-associated protein 251-like [Durio zibethinus]|uniref:Cilia- and flagella-associated protein 251-like n=1 Tax=Durio zibethinus TaxID=66656 RepID=A0A6P6ANK1_DURZI|nr:cilia- and flagella-associated protein 251-like [Durio zibethinus]